MKTLTLLAVLSLTGCAVGPDYHPPKTKVSANWGEPTLGGATNSPAKLAQWWKTFNDPEYRLEFRPRNGDIIVFDNWRILHARDEVFGLPIRQHWRAWITTLKPTLLPKYYLGIRPVAAATAAKIEAANKKRVSIIKKPKTK